MRVYAGARARVSAQRMYRVPATRMRFYGRTSAGAGDTALPEGMHAGVREPWVLPCTIAQRQYPPPT